MTDSPFANADARASARWLAIYLVLWTTIAIVAATTTFIALGRSSVDAWLAIFGTMLAYFWCWAVLGLALHALASRLRFTAKSVLPLCLLHLCLAAATSVGLVFLVHPADWSAWLYGERSPGFHALNVFIYAFVLTSSLLWQYHGLSEERRRAAEAAERMSLRLERDLDAARIDALRLQINPHFLFNTLNSIGALIEAGDRGRAYRTLEMLAGLLRTTLYRNGNVLVPLADEIAFVEQYVALEQLRFGDRFVFETRVEVEVRELAVPPLILQPLVENAIKHGVARTSQPVHVFLGACIDSSDGELRAHIRVADDGPGLAGNHDPGRGLDNVRERLALIYGDSAGMRFETGSASGLTVDIELPTAAPAVSGLPGPASQRGASRKGSP